MKMWIAQFPANLEDIIQISIFLRRMLQEQLTPKLTK